MANVKYKILTCIFAVLTLFACFVTTFTVVHAKDNTVEYTDVLEDLKKDSNFNELDYPRKANGYSLNVIQIAESEDKELFIYVYNPSAFTKELIANEIRLSTPEVGKEVSYTDKKLKLLNKNGVFYKYKVENFIVKDTMVRYYDIVQVARPFYKDIDKAPENGNTVGNVACDVSQKWEAVTLDGKTTYKMVELETITITDKYVGFVRYSNGFKFFVDKCDSHFVAFNTDRKIDNLLEAELTWVEQPYTYTYDNNISSDYYGEEKEKLAVLKADQTGGNNPGWLFSKTYTWDRIERIEDFLEYEDSDAVTITKEGQNALKDTKWVLRFKETPYHMIYISSPLGGITGYQYSQTHISDVTILRLKFETDGEPYNLGVVDNKQTGSKNPVATVSPDIGDLVTDWFKDFFKVLILVVLVVLIIIIALAFGPLIISLLSSLLSFIGKLLVKILKLLWKVIVFILIFPFNLLGKLFKKKDKESENE